MGATGRMDNEGGVHPAGRMAGADVDPGEAERVTRFLRNNPDWLARQAGLYECLSPPRRVHGEALADHMAAMIEAARQRSRTVLDAGRAGLGLSERVRAAVLSLMRCGEPGEWIASDLPRLLGLDAARLCREGDGDVGATAVPHGTVERVLGQREVVIRPGSDAADAALLHGEAAGLARQEALLRVSTAGMPPALLALAARNAAVLEGAGAEAALGFLAAALAARMERA